MKDHRGRRFPIVNRCAWVVIASSVLLWPAQASAQSACASLEPIWFQRVAAGTPVSYGYTSEGSVQQSNAAKAAATPFSAIGVATLLGTSAIVEGTGARISGLVSGSERQNIGGVAGTASFGTQSSTFTIGTNDCTGTISRTFSDGSVVLWHIVVVDGGDAIQYLDMRKNPTISPGVLRIMR
jgi:hypothetical protein